MAFVAPIAGLQRCAYYPNTMTMVYYGEGGESRELSLASFFPEPTSWPSLSTAGLLSFGDWVRTLVQAKLAQHPGLQHLEWTIHD